MNNRLFVVACSAAMSAGFIGYGQAGGSQVPADGGPGSSAENRPRPPPAPPPRSPPPVAPAGDGRVLFFLFCFPPKKKPGRSRMLPAS